MTLSLLLIAVLAALYTILVDSYHPVDWLTGGLLTAAAFRFVLGRPIPRAGAADLGRRLVPALRLLAGLAADAARGSASVARIVLQGYPSAAPAYLELHYGSELSADAAAAFGLMQTLAPGTVLLDVDPEKRTCLFHVLECPEPEKVRRRLHQMLEHYCQALRPHSQAGPA